YACEIYSEKRSPFWMSPANLDGTDEQGVVRIDLFWFAGNNGNPDTDYYPQFWKLLAPFDYKLHWGKHLPPDSAAYLKPRYANGYQFRELRARMAPAGIFRTPYWLKHLFGETRAGLAAAETREQTMSATQSSRSFATVMVIAAIIASAFGLALLAIPNQLAHLLDVQLGPGAWVARLFGVAEIGAGLLAWWVKGTSTLAIKKLGLRQFIFIDGLAFAISVLAQLKGVYNGLGWAIAGVFLFFTTLFLIEIWSHPQLYKARVF